MSEKTKKTAIMGILAALTIALSFLESLIDLPFLPAGAKLGLANIAVMFAILTLGGAYGVILTVLKSLFVLLTRGAAAFFMSICGGLLSVIVLILLARLPKISYIAMSVISAVVFNLGQILAASVYMKTNLIFSYLPILTVCGVAAGIVTGAVLSAVMKALKKLPENVILRKPAGSNKEKDEQTM